MKKSLIILLVLVVAFSMLMTGCGDSKAASTEEAQQKDSLVIAYTDEPDSLDCHNTSKNMSEKMCANIYATLLTFDDKYQVQPYVAKSWEISDDNLTYTFHLRDDVFFHDGKQMTANDVLYSMERGKASSYSSYYLEAVKEFKVVDDYTIQMVLNEPYAPLLNMLCEPFLGIINKESVDELGDAFGQTPVGSGPYKVVEWVPGTKIELEAFDKFFEGAPPIKNITVKFIPDPSTKLISLENGEVDVADSIATNNIASVEDNDSLVMLQTPSAKYCYMGINNQSEKFKNVKFRQAINCAINKEAIIQIAQDGIAQEAACSISDQAFGYPKNLKGYKYDVDMAKQLLTESGSNVTELNMICKDAVTKKVAESIQADLNKIGIKVNVSVLEAGGYYDAIGKGNFDTFIGAWSDSLMDADPVVGMRYHSKFVGDPGNYDWLEDQKVDDLIAAGRVESDKAKREAIYAEMFQYVSDQAVEVPLFYYVSNLGASKDLKGIKALTTGMYYYNDWSW
jgi:peptide/nickel transport system substrate-binding protein